MALLPRAYADPLLASGEAPGLVASHWNLQLQSYAFAVAPGNSALRERLQKGLNELERDGRLEALRVRWLSSHRDVAERDALRGRPGPHNAGGPGASRVPPAWRSPCWVTA